METPFVDFCINVILGSLAFVVFVGSVSVAVVMVIASYRVSAEKK
jgi:hypothetical protein